MSAPGRPPTTAREPSQDRSRATRHKLLEATVDCLAEYGWTGTTVGVVAARAGVSRGASQHHFTTRDELVAAAVRHVAARWTEGVRQRGQRLRPREGRTAAVLEMLVELYSGRLGRAAAQLWVAASTDAALRELVLPLADSFNRDAYAISIELLGSDLTRPGVKESLQLSLDMARGLGLARLLRDDPRRRRAELRQWAAMLEAVPGAVTVPGTDGRG